MILIPARSDVAPVWYRIVDRLCARGTVAQRQLAVTDLATSPILLNEVEGAQGILVFDLG